MSIESAMSSHLILCLPLFLLSSCMPGSGSFPMNRLLISGAQSTGISASASRPSNEFQGWFLWGLTGLILEFKGLSRIFSSTTVWKHQSFHGQPSLWSNSYPYMGTEKTTALTIWAFVSKVMSLLLLCCLGLSYPYCLPKIVFWNEELVFKFSILPMCTTHKDIYWECSQQYNILQIVFKNMFCVSVLTYCMH